MVHKAEGVLVREGKGAWECGGEEGEGERSWGAGGREGGQGAIQNFDLIIKIIKTYNY